MNTERSNSMSQVLTKAQVVEASTIQWTDIRQRRLGALVMCVPFVLRNPYRGKKCPSWPNDPKWNTPDLDVRIMELKEKLQRYGGFKS
jgi:hypothetical protein